MAAKMTGVIQHICRLAVSEGAGRPDGELLNDFVRRRDQDALVALVHRHGPMVWGVCRRLLRVHQDAEDAFQATFLVLVHKAGTIRDKGLVANWLYGVAQQTAVRMRATAARRQVRERPMLDMPLPAVGESDDPLLPYLDQELSRLPDKYRVLIVLCDLEGKTRKEAARQLGCPEGTVAGRLSRARMMLANRLAKHRSALPVVVLAALLTQRAASACVPASVVNSTMKAATLVAAGKAATGMISAPVAALTDGVLKSMLLTKLKAVAATAFLMLGMAGLLAHGLASARQGGDSVTKRPADPKSPPGEGKGEKANPKAAVDAIAWGKPFEGLQAGIGFRPGEKPSFHVGRSATFFVYLKNVGEKKIEVSHIEPLFEEFLLTVEDEKGKKQSVVPGPMNLGVVPIVKRPLEKGQTIRLTAYLMIVASGTKDEAAGPRLVAGPGKYRVHHTGFPIRRPGKDSDEQKWATGHVEIQIEGPAADPKPAPGAALPDDAASWSKPIRGLQARITLVEKPKFNGIRSIVPYLELRNVSDSAYPMKVRCDGGHVKFELIDADGKVVRSGGKLPSDRPPSGPGTIVLPLDSSIRIGMYAGGWGVPKDAPAMILTDSGAWVFEPQEKGKVFLRATVKGAKVESDPYRTWYGTIETPPVKVDWRE